MPKETLVSVVLRFPDPTPAERARANAYFAALERANRECATKAELQEAYNRIWREFNQPAPTHTKAPAGLWNKPNKPIW